MTEQRVSLRYAKAVYETALAAGTLDTVYNDFIAIGKVLNQSQLLRTMLKSPVIKTWKKKNVFKELFSNMISELSFNFIQLIADKEREFLLKDIIASFDKLYLAKMNIIKADIVTSREVDETLRTKILTELSRRLEKTVIPTFKVDESIIGGIMIRVEDWVYDASVQNQLAKLRNQLIEGKLI
ncbi:MAG: ATP synthase F1 subunit delta [Candidatus Kapabacteria bacterium]|nr:ATP synthase F1 subunit delta [Ignavibacteriota bacterium]MCW5886060.1 ATP synthase F1 subunit delta [Candidatus Kapabacteria bacterium]